MLELTSTAPFVQRTKRKTSARVGKEYFLRFRDGVLSFFSDDPSPDFFSGEGTGNEHHKHPVAHAALGDAATELGSLYRDVLLGPICHELSAMRGLGLALPAAFRTGHTWQRPGDGPGEPPLLCLCVLQVLRGGNARGLGAVGGGGC